MFRFLRKYSRIILAVGGTLLLIAFLIPQALTGLAQYGGQAGATRAVVGPDETAIDNAEWRNYQRQLELLQAFGFQLPGIGAISEPDHWYLLVREARMQGLTGGLQSQVLPGAQLAQLQQSGRASEAVINETVMNLNGVWRMLREYMESTKFSDVRLRHAARRLFHEVDTELVIINADPDAVDYHPTEDELAAHLEEYGDVPPGEGEMGFGYRLPDRAKIEWITIDADAVREQLQDSDAMSRIELRKHWLRNPDGTFPEVDREAPTPDVVRDHLLQQLMADRVEEISRFAYNQLRDPMRSLEREEGYYILPENWPQQRLPMPALAERIVDQFNIELPAYRAIGDQWLDESELSELNGISNGTTDRFGQPPRDLADLVMAAREFGGSPAIVMQEGLAAPPLIDDQNNIYVFRITDADPSRPPKNVDEVRDQLVGDLKRLRHYEQLVAASQNIKQIAVNDGLLELAVQHAAEVRSGNLALCNPFLLQMIRQTGQTLAPQPTPVPGLGQATELVEAVVERSLSLPAEAPVSAQPLDQRVLVEPHEDGLALVAFKIRGHTPVTQQQFQQMVNDGSLRSLVLSDEFRNEVLIDVFGRAALAKRHQFELRTRIDDQFPATQPSPDDEPEQQAARSAPVTPAS